jgi:hypothetical protein
MMPRHRNPPPSPMTRFALLWLFLSLLAISPAGAQQPAEAFLIRGNGDATRVWITAATATTIRYKETAVAGELRDGMIADFPSIHILEPPALSDAIELYQARNYTEAKDKFAAVKTTYKDIRTLPDNPSTDAAFLELECLRKSGDLEGLAKTLETFDKAPLTRESQLRQVELYAMWEAARTRDWGRLERICEERLQERMPGFQRAQIAYCLGLALDSQDRPIPALNAFHIAMTADGGASEEIARPAALKALRLYQKDPAVQDAIKHWGTPGEASGSAGRQRLREAAGLARLYQLTLGGGTPLPDEFKSLLGYLPKSESPEPVEMTEPENDQ